MLKEYLSLFKIGEISTHKLFPFSLSDLSDTDKNNKPKPPEELKTITLGDELFYYIYLLIIHPWLYPLIKLGQMSEDQLSSIQWFFGQKSKELFLTHHPKLK